MNQPATGTPSEEWVRILGKGMVTIPKSWREELGLVPGKIVKAKKVGRQVVLEAEEAVPYRTYTDSEIKEFLAEDKYHGQTELL